MKSRILSAVVLIPLLLVVLIALPPIATAILLAVMCAVAAYELLAGTGYVKHPRLIGYTMLAAALMAVWQGLGAPAVWGYCGIFLYCCVLFAEMLLSKGKLPFQKVLWCMAGGLLIPWLLCALVRIRNMENGVFFVLLPFILAFISDSGAYFVGIFLGKTKLAPSISPKKTVEGLFGGVAAAILGAVLFGLMMMAFSFRVNFLYAILYGVISAFVCVMGDLIFSVIKRQTGIKDYGKLIPGHGGILDRFDSMTVVGPATELLLLILPIAEKFNG